MNNDKLAFANSLSKYSRLETRKIHVGTLSLGGDAPIRIQSMTTTDTNNVDASTRQSIQIINAGGEIVRLTTQGEKEARNIGLIRAELDKNNHRAPLVADVHFNPNAALTAAARVEAVRINPGNFTGEAKRFNADADKLSDEQWHNLIINKLRPLVETCKQHHTAIRIGVNHGSLSDRVMAKYGDTPQGMVASCTEYIDALEQLDFRQIAISIKSSNTRVMVQTVRLLAATLRQRGAIYPLHLGVTEAGSDAEGRIKSAAGIGALLNDGIGDTIRVSLTEAPEAEIPVARSLADHCARLANTPDIGTPPSDLYSPFAYNRRPTVEALGIGSTNHPIVATQGQSQADWTLSHDLSAVTTQKGQTIHITTSPSTPGPCLIKLTLNEVRNLPDTDLANLRHRSDAAILAPCQSGNHQAELRALALELTNRDIPLPLICLYESAQTDFQLFQLQMSADLGGLLIDGLIDGIAIVAPHSPQQVADTALMLLQATRARFSRTEFISCPGCGRTLYDIQSTVALIKSQFGHLKGLKIGIMGCIVNGIGEMADADYGYVGAGRGKISLYRGKELVRRSLDQEEALAALKQLITDDGKWIEP